MATLKDVAARAGVSAMTVSNVINGRTGKVSAPTIARVQEAISALGYVPSAAARSLAGSSRILALVYEAQPGRPALETAHEALFVGVCEQAARAEGYALMLCGSSKAEDTVAQLRSWNVAGAIVMATTRMPPGDFLDRSGVPAVFIDAYRETGEISYVNVDDAGGARMAGERLGRAGHRRVAFVGPTTGIPGVVRERLRGLREGLAAHGGGVEREDVLRAEVDFDEGVAVAGRLVDRMTAVSAVFASGDVLALGIVMGLRRAGRRVPEDVSVVGFDGLALAGYSDPPLTTVRQPIRDKATTAVAYLLEELRSGDGAPRQVVLPVSWQAGGTLGQVTIHDKRSMTEL
ncbi:transcriptional regulator, LacI family [Actinomyces ruminicola]|uniref:Transcriptional regulator, LacI family n=1 Tax=Actinomyces ruminicola TaxID=332524 RepID=A0A1H0DQV1_9ACTO|nr:LacI family DNA-binding transcriptional regulator [Actinomyces ruminicola]SDN72426.1 transcriptional regulator, LacI family [Actinomyces ruminicola]